MQPLFVLYSQVNAHNSPHVLRRMPLIHTGEKISSNKAGNQTEKISVVLVKAVDYSYVHKLYKRLSGKRLHVRCYNLVVDLPERGGRSLGDLLGTRGIVVRRCPGRQPGGCGYLLACSFGNVSEIHVEYTVLFFVWCRTE
jgi:hypothetical protein